MELGVNNPYTNKTYVYAYNKGGNITSVKEYAYTTSTTLGTATATNTYTYGDSNWKDKLTAYNGTVVVLPGNHDYYNADVKVWMYFKDVMQRL